MKTTNYQNAIAFCRKRKSLTRFAAIGKSKPSIASQITTKPATYWQGLTRYNAIRTAKANARATLDIARFQLSIGQLMSANNLLMQAQDELAAARMLERIS